MSLVLKGLYRHYKGKVYVVEAIARLEKDETEMVVYRELTSDKLYTRPKKEFEERVTETTTRFERWDNLIVTVKPNN